MKSERRTTSVIGLLLMTAITVLMAGVVAYFVFSMSGVMTGSNKVTTFTKTITVARFEEQVIGSSGVIDTEGYGYYVPLPNRLDLNGVYNITYIVNPYKERWITGYTPLTTGSDPYTCIEKEGVCR